MGQILNWAHKCMAWLYLVPLFEPMLSNGGDGLSKVVEEPMSKQSMMGGTRRPAGLQVGPVGPTCQPLVVCFGGLPSGVF